MKHKYPVIIVAAIILIGSGFMVAKVTQRNDTSKSAVATNASNDNHAAGSSVDLSGQQLNTIPDSVLSRSDITNLNVSNNQLMGLPADISKLVNLEVLNVENNRLVSLAPELSQLKNLREIRANNNRMNSLPAELKSMKQLKYVDVSGNNLSTADIDQLKAALPDTEIKS